MIGRLLTPFAKRFVAGETIREVVRAVQEVNVRGMGALIDYLGEDIRTPQASSAGADEYAKLLEQISTHRLQASVSLKVSQMGLLFSQETCLTNIRRLLKRADELKEFIWLDMEGSNLTQKTIEVFDLLRRDFTNIALCLQAYLVRTGGDLDALMRQPLTVRLCKGAYKEPSDIAFARKSAVDGNFRMLIHKAFDRTGEGVYPAFATHDPQLIAFIRQQAAERKIPRDRFEFQMLYGIQNQLLESLAQEGYRTQVYIPYGTAWLPYFLRRLRERRENLYFLMRNVFRR